MRRFAVLKLGSIKVGVPKGSRGGGRAPGARINFSGALTVEDDLAIGTTLGTFTVSGATGTPTFTLDDDAGGVFVLDGDQLEIATPPDIGTSPLEIVVSVTGSTPDPADASFVFTVIEDHYSFLGNRYFGPRHFGERYWA